MKLVVYDPGPKINGYLTIKCLDPLVKYCGDIGVQVELINTLDGLANSAVLAHASYFTPEVILRLKNSGNRLYSFDINDSSWLYHLDAVHDVDLIFKFSGIQQTRYSDEIQVSKDIEYSKRPRPFFAGDPDEKWNAYANLRDAGKLIPMPYAPNYHEDVAHIPFEQKNKHALIRGGNHYIRFHLFLNLLKAGLINSDSAFPVKCYFGKSMVDQFKYCPDCLKTFETHGKISYQHYLDRETWGCNNPYIKWNIDPTDEDFRTDTSHKWNNRCLPLFYWLTERFQKQHGNIDMSLVENALNADYLSEAGMYPILARNMFYGDYKWVFSVDLPPRFWQGANAKIINLLPAWTKNQAQFPKVVEGDHYLAFDEIFEDIDKLKNITKEQHDHITNNCFEMYNTWIKGDEYEVSVNLLKYVLDNIRRIENG